MKITITCLNSVHGSVHAKLSATLGREPTAAELKQAVANIIRSTHRKPRQP